MIPFRYVDYAVLVGGKHAWQSSAAVTLVSDLAAFLLSIDGAHGHRCHVDGDITSGGRFIGPERNYDFHCLVDCWLAENSYHSDGWRHVRYGV